MVDTPDSMTAVLFELLTDVAPADCSPLLLQIASHGIQEAARDEIVAEYYDSDAAASRRAEYFDTSFSAAKCQDRAVYRIAEELWICQSPSSSASPP